MNTIYCIGRLPSRLALFLLSAALMLSCGTTRNTTVLDRSARPEVVAGVPAGASEIREVKFHKAASESGHQVIHLRGQLFTKKESGGGSVQISPCGGCVIQLTSPSDTTITANLTTAADGYFEFNGKILPYTFTLKTPGMNPLVLESVEFDKEGFMTMKIIQAAGSSPERFRITKSGDTYTWIRAQ
jgi:hypothetical protein